MALGQSPQARLDDSGPVTISFSNGSYLEFKCKKEYELYIYVKVLKEQRCEKEAALRAAQVQGPSTHLQDAGEGLLNDPSIAPQARVSIPRRFPTSVVGHDDVHPPITPATPSPMTLVPPMHGGVSCALDLQAGSNPSLLQHSTNRPSQGKRTPLERTYELRSKNLPQGYNLRSRLSMQPTPRLRGTYGRAAGAYMREVYGSK